MVTFANRAKVSTSTTGTGTITLGTAVDGYQSFTSAGVVNSDVVRYTIEDGDAWEIGSGTYSAGTLTRVLDESSTGSLLNLSGDAVVYVTAAGEDIVQPSDLATVATSGAYSDLSGLPSLGTAAAADTGDFATAAQGALADSALQSGDNVSALTNDAGYTTNVGDITGVTAGSGISGGGTSGTVTVSHADTSSQGSVNNSGATFIQDVTVDTYGHVTALGSATISPATIGAATSAQGALADSATQPGDNISTLTNDSGYLTGITGQSIKNLSDVYSSMSPTDGQVLTYDTTNGWQAETAAAGATGGGTDQIFWENGQTVTTNYTITNGKNAMSAGPITINSGVTVTVGAGEVWTVV